MSDSPWRRNAADAVPYPVRVAAAFSWRVLMVAGLFVVVGYVLITLRLAVISIAVALLLTALLLPMVNQLHRRRVPRSVATAVVMVSGLALISGMLTFVIQAFVAGLPDLQGQVAQSVDQIGAWLEEDPPFGLPPVNLENLGNSIRESFQNVDAGAVTSGALSTAATVGEFFAGFILALFLLVFFLYSGRSMWLYVIKVVPETVRDRVDLAGQRSFASLGWFVRALVVVAVVDAIGIGIGLWAVDAPLVVPLMALIFLAAFVPIIGAFLSGAVAVLVVLVANGLIPALIVFGVVIGVQQLEGNVLHPLLLGRAVSLHPVAVVLAVTVGGVAAGIAGVLLAVPLLAVLNSGIRSLLGADGDGESDQGDRSDDADGGQADPDPLVRTVLRTEDT